MIKAVEDTGYGAEVADTESVDKEKEIREKEIKNLKNTFIVSVVLSLPLLAAMMTSLFNTAIPLLHAPWFQLVIASPV